MSAKAFMRYCMACYLKRKEEREYSYYMSECLFTILENQSRRGGKYMTQHYYEKFETPQREETAGEIIERLAIGGAIKVVK